VRQRISSNVRFEVDALGVVIISRGCSERCCSNKKTPSYHSNLSFVTLRNRRPTLLCARAYCTPSEASPQRRCGHASPLLWDASSMVTAGATAAGATANTMEGNSRTCRESRMLCSHSQTVYNTKGTRARGINRGKGLGLNVTLCAQVIRLSSFQS